jgi:hypothetical protein
LKNVRKRLVFVPDGPFQSLLARPGAYFRVEPLKVASPGQAPGLSANILGLKGLLGETTVILTKCCEVGRFRNYSEKKQNKYVTLFFFSVEAMF